MSHHQDHSRKDRHIGTGAPRPERYAAPADPSLYNGMPSATNREWGPDRSNNAYSFGYDGQGGYGESQGPDAQSGHVARGHRGRGPPLSRSDHLRHSAGIRPRHRRGPWRVRS